MFKIFFFFFLKLRYLRLKRTRRMHRGVVMQFLLLQLFLCQMKSLFWHHHFTCTTDWAVLCSAVVMAVVPAKWAFSKCGLLKTGFKATMLFQFTIHCEKLIVNPQHAHKRPIICRFSLKPQSNSSPTPDIWFLFLTSGVRQKYVLNNEAFPSVFHHLDKDKSF